MAKVFAILMIVVGVWAAGQIYTNGAANAFGGALVTLGLAEATPGSDEPQSLGQRAGGKVGRAHAEAEARRDRLLAE